MKISIISSFSSSSSRITWKLYGVCEHWTFQTTALLMQIIPPCFELRGKYSRGELWHRYYKLRNRDRKRITWAKYRNTHTREQSLLELVFELFKQQKVFFTKNQAQGVLVSILTLKYSLLCLKLWNTFKMELGYNDLLTFIADFCVIFTLWASRALVYNGRNLWIVYLCSEDLR